MKETLAAGISKTARITVDEPRTLDLQAIRAASGAPLLVQKVASVA